MDVIASCGEWGCTRGGIHARLKKRLGRGAERIDAVLDLHGLTLAQAHGQLHHFLGLAVQRGQRTVLVITGKGREGEGVLRRSVPVWLDAESSLGIVQGYDSAANHHGGSGAFYVRLRRVVHGNDGGRG